MQETRGEADVLHEAGGVKACVTRYRPFADRLMDQRPPGPGRQIAQRSKAVLAALRFCPCYDLGTIDTIGVGVDDA